MVYDPLSLPISVSKVSGNGLKGKLLTHLKSQWKTYNHRPTQIRPQSILDPLSCIDFLPTLCGHAIWRINNLNQVVSFCLKQTFVNVFILHESYTLHSESPVPLSCNFCCVLRHSHYVTRAGF